MLCFLSITEHIHSYRNKNKHKGQAKIQEVLFELLIIILQIFGIHQTQMPKYDGKQHKYRMVYRPKTGREICIGIRLSNQGFQFIDINTIEQNTQNKLQIQTDNRNNRKFYILKCRERNFPDNSKKRTHYNVACQNH